MRAQLSRVNDYIQLALIGQTEQYPDSDSEHQQGRSPITIKDAFKIAGMAEGTLRSISGIFDFMEVAEKRIAHFEAQYPEKRDIIHDSFRYLQPSQILYNKSLHVYEKHCDEIIQRVIDGTPLHLPTSAEICCVVGELSLKAPINNDFTMFGLRHFIKAFGEEEGERLLKISEVGRITFSHKDAEAEIYYMFCKKHSFDRDARG